MTINSFKELAENPEFIRYLKEAREEVAAEIGKKNQPRGHKKKRNPSDNDSPSPASRGPRA